VSPDTLRLILQITGVVVGGGILEFIRRLLARRAELRNLNAQSDATISSSYKDLVETLRTESHRYQQQVKDFQERIAQLEARADQAQREFTEKLNVAHVENTRLASRVAQLQTDNDIAERQISELRYRARGI
jgi:predicted RNase H-like nuclease (RuvC/YqgF family)